MNDPGERLLNLAKALSDGEEVDWARAEADARDGEERELMTLLRDIGQVAEIHRTLRREGEPPRSVSTTLQYWGRLEVGKKIGQGASAEVFRARDPQLDREVALKLFWRGPWMRPENRKSLLLEGQNLARLRHENVVSVYGADEHEERVGIWMELVEGRTLSDIVLKQGPHSATEATQIGIELCRALAAVHRKRLVHADIKAQNVKREEGGRIVLMDFSSSRRSDASPGNPESDPAGTPLYMAPELWEKNSPTVESDIYALGVLLYHLVTGDFPVKAPSIELLRQAHSNQERRLLRDERPELPDAFVRTVERALSRNPAERYQSAGAFEEVLRAQQEPVNLKTPPVPLEFRVIAGVARISLWVGTIFLVLTFLGFVTSTLLNVVLRRPSDFAPQTVYDWFVWGARSMIGPAYHAFVTVVPILGIMAAARLSYCIKPVQRRFAGVVRFADETLSHVRLVHVVVAGALAVAALASWHSDLINKMFKVAYGAHDEATLLFLSPANEAYHLAYRRHYTVLLIVLGLAGMVILGRLKAKRRPIPLGLSMGMGIVLVCAAVLLEAPWQVLWQADFPKVALAGETCYEVGSKGDDLLLFCPESQTRIVPRGDARLVPTGVIESVFARPKK